MTDCKDVSCRSRGKRVVSLILCIGSMIWRTSKAYMGGRCSRSTCSGTAACSWRRSNTALCRYLPNMVVAIAIAVAVESAGQPTPDVPFLLRPPRRIPCPHANCGHWFKTVPGLKHHCSLVHNYSFGTPARTSDSHAENHSTPTKPAPGITCDYHNKLTGESAAL